jgi:hypothetical protein
MASVIKIDDIQVNDGLMRLGIKGTVLKVEKGLKSNYTMYQIEG